MKKTLVAILCLLPLPMLAAEKWLDAYNLGVTAVRANNFQNGAVALQQSVDEMPQENAAQRVRDQIFTYVPHFWLGIARLNLADPDGALREWKISEEQGAIQNTPYYAQLRDLIGRANAEKQRRAEGAATPARQESNSAIGRALSAQMDAVTAGGDRSDTYHSAQRKLREAKEINGKGGVDVRAYKHAADIAEEARGLFAAAADEAKKQRASRPAKILTPQRTPAAGEVVIPFDGDRPQPRQPVQTQPQPVPLPLPLPAPQPPVPQPALKSAPKPQLSPVPEAESEAMVDARIAVQRYRQRLLALHLATIDAERLEHKLAGQKNPTAIGRIAEEIAAKQRALDVKEASMRKPAESRAPADSTRAQLETAYRSFAAGDLASSERELTQLLAVRESAEAYLLRGCSRYTQAMLSRDPDPLLARATADMQSALRINASLRLDRKSWSPKLVAFFERVKNR